ncbi:glycosyltransferase involved in cell wall biosynthesis [Gillisia mitskevichiae]|uniref:Glycosyltransferase involved in cell wall biosynthesis n=1 Tax=Gillisia mitskevichiae TaxID=270921 RepID=A0A495PXF6_9FLAO|nr:glycosyltransferase family 4 protein [Gillisia mitskevichiae]RKS53469.1 glycosyltransferase involved in cell wall biosynthesis [Gillisia mitskevichiae]
MNILHVSAVKSWGGGENHIENLCNELHQISPSTQNSVLCLKNGLFHKKLQNSKISFETVSIDFKMDLRFCFKLISICRKQHIDLIHIHDSTALTLCIMADHLYNLPPFVFSKKTTFPIRSRKQTLYKYNYKKIKKILCVSEATKAITATNVNDPSKLVSIYHGTKVNGSCSTEAINIRDQYEIEPLKKIIGNIANHNWPKDLDTFINVANNLINERGIKNLHFIQIGNYTTETPDLIKKIEKFNLSEHITLTNVIPNASRLILQFDISLVTSKSEGVPQFIYESFLNKVPVVSTNVGGISEIIEHETNGLLATAEDFMKLADHVVLLLENSELKERFVNISYNEVREKYTTEMMAKKTLQEYKLVLHGK